MTVDPLIQSLKGKLVVSVQAYMGEPLRTPETMAQMSRACELGGGPGELHRVIAAVHADSHATALALLTLGGDDVGKALGGPANHMNIHVM